MNCCGCEKGGKTATAEAQIVTLRSTGKCLPFPGNPSTKSSTCVSRRGFRKRRPICSASSIFAAAAFPCSICASNSGCPPSRQRRRPASSCWKSRLQGRFVLGLVADRVIEVMAFSPGEIAGAGHRRALALRIHHGRRSPRRALRHHLRPDTSLARRRRRLQAPP